MSDTHFRGKVAQKVLLYKDNKVLITRDSRDKEFELPGGRLDNDEEPKEGILREIREELGIESKLEQIFDIKTMFHGRDKETMIFIYYTASLVEENPTFKTDPLEVEEMKWVDKDSLLEYDMFPQYKEVLIDYFNKTI